MISKIKTFFNSILEQENIPAAADDHRIAITALLCEVCNADHIISEEEEITIERTLSKLLLIDQTQAKSLLQTGKEKIKSSNSLFDFTSQLRAADYDIRSRLIRAMWEVAYADNHLDPIEEHIIRKVSDLIYVKHSEFIRTKLSVIEALP
ncbi:TerB family tellurite resistance protein [Psychromonas antarctica]|uniref:tellurite resistance TerB family protein n=1 Tax=Psychromonas antarctica TaxID=67573 RepID=UPI001EE865C0|nr:TerB family tellurite resistance protein [Psychromonas antarctica]MCG6201511.1 TerB family tellurite resistance protein [Psychromonas antarctica]